MGVRRRHLVECDLQHDRQGQVAVEQGHTVGEAQAFSRPRRRRRRQQQPVDSSVRIPGGVQAHLHVGPGRDLHLPHGERSPSSRPQAPSRAPEPSWARPRAPSLRFDGDADSTRRQPVSSGRPRPGARPLLGPECRQPTRHVAAPNSASPAPKRRSLPHAKPGLSVRAASGVTPTWYSLIGLEGLVCPITGSIQPCPAFDWKLKRVARGLIG